LIEDQDGLSNPMTLSSASFDWIYELVHRCVNLFIGATEKLGSSDKQGTADFVMARVALVLRD
jgi:hypothetical protein